MDNTGAMNHPQGNKCQNVPLYGHHVMLYIGVAMDDMKQIQRERQKKDNHNMSKQLLLCYNCVIYYYLECAS